MQKVDGLANTLSVLSYLARFYFGRFFIECRIMLIFFFFKTASIYRLRCDATAFTDGALTWKLQDNTTASVMFAYYPPYSLEMQVGVSTGRHRVFIGSS